MQIDRSGYLHMDSSDVEVPVGDSIDRIVEDWKQERPDLDLTPTEVIGRIQRLSVHLRRGVEEVLTSFDLHAGGFAVLAALRRSGEPYRMTPTQLFTTLLSSSGAMTNRLDRIEQAGLIRRVADPSDRRGTLVELTPDGLAQADRAAEAHLANEQELLAALTNSQQEQLASLLRDLLVSFEGEPCQEPDSGQNT